VLAGELRRIDRLRRDLRPAVTRPALPHDNGERLVHQQQAMTPRARLRRRFIEYGPFEHLLARRADPPVGGPQQRDPVGQFVRQRERPVRPAVSAVQDRRPRRPDQQPAAVVTVHGEVSRRVYVRKRALVIGSRGCIERPHAKAQSSQRLKAKDEDEVERCENFFLCELCALA
jgi:hypothetical protein